jgi:hypothetical protein
LKGNQLVEGWQFQTIVQLQSGNPVNLITSINTLNQVANTLRPDVTGPVTYPETVERWFDTAVFVNPTVPVTHFGSLGRNVVIGPGFNNTDFSVTKTTKLNESMRVQFRTKFSDLFNHGTSASRAVSSGRLPSAESPTRVSPPETPGHPGRSSSL